MCDVHGEFGLISVHLFDILPEISFRKIVESLGFFSVWRVVTP